jgi:NADH:ubiquinone oxidoreductase subunit 6 (subunit J)
MNPINLYSALLLLVVVILFSGFLLLRRGVSLARVAVIVLIGLVLVAGWWFMRPVQTPHADLAELQGKIGAGKPVLLEFQSPY